MHATAKVMTFEEFRAASMAAEPIPIAEVVRQQRAFFRDAAVAQQAVRLALLSVLQWISWDADRTAG
jgi:hypothetical protein